jgi:hypothetical protein
MSVRGRMALEGAAGWAAATVEAVEPDRLRWALAGCDNAGPDGRASRITLTPAASLKCLAAVISPSASAMASKSTLEDPRRMSPPVVWMTVELVVTTLVVVVALAPPPLPACEDDELMRPRWFGEACTAALDPDLGREEPGTGAGSTLTSIEDTWVPVASSIARLRSSASLAARPSAERLRERRELREEATEAAGDGERLAREEATELAPPLARLPLGGGTGMSFSLDGDETEQIDMASEAFELLLPLPAAIPGGA